MELFKIGKLMAFRKRRTYTSEFKAAVVLAVISGEKTVAEVCREHCIKPSLLTRWKQQSCGTRRLTAQLRRAPYWMQVSRKRVQRVMRQKDWLQGVSP